MGMNFMFSSCSCDPQTTGQNSPFNYEPVDTPVAVTGNPNPRQFRILAVKQIGWMLVADIKYLGCKNYEGRKTLVFKNVTEHSLRSASFLDPHFCDRKGHLTPIARFEPTIKGWVWAIEFCQSQTRGAT